MVCPVILAKQGCCITESCRSRTHSGPSELTSHHGKPGCIPHHKHQEVIFPPQVNCSFPCMQLTYPSQCCSSRGSPQPWIWREQPHGSALPVQHHIPGDGLTQATLLPNTAEPNTALTLLQEARAEAHMTHL